MQRSGPGIESMLIITIKVNAPGWMAQGIKEHLAMCLERFGDTKVISIQENEQVRQMQMNNMKGGIKTND